MTESTFKRLAEQARKRHLGDPEWEKKLGIVRPADRQKAFWYWWSAWQKDRSLQPTMSLSYKGRNDPTANAAIGMSEKGGA